MNDVTIPVDLLTRTGDPVTTVLVPPYKLPPEVIVWGDRFFVRDPANQYREGMAHVVPVAPAEPPPTGT